MGDSYKSAKEAFVSDTKGSTIFHINVISFVALVSVISILSNLLLTLDMITTSVLSPSTLL